MTDMIKDTSAEDEHVLGLSEIEAPNTADEQVAEGQVEEPPEHVDRRRGQPFPWR
jgi:hypothetical protein